MAKTQCAGCVFSAMGAVADVGNTAERAGGILSGITRHQNDRNTASARCGQASCRC